MTSVCSCVLVLILQIVCGQYSNSQLSPCPNIFVYVNDGRNIYGQITVQPLAPAQSVQIRINFTVAVQLHNNYVGELVPHDSNKLLETYNSGRPVTYIVYFPVTSPLPRVTLITINGEPICHGPGDRISQNNLSVVTVSLQHTSFMQSGGGLSYDNFQYQPQTRPQVIDDDAAAIIWFNRINPSWNTENTPNYVVNNTSPDTSQHTQQVFQSRPTTYHYVEPVRAVTPVYKEPELTSPVIKPAEPTAAITATPNRISNTEEPEVECGVVYGGNNKIPLIYNGDEYERGEIPWLVAIYKSVQGSIKFICGGTLVSDRHVVTAAHCMLQRSTLTSTKDILVKTGVHNLNDWTDEMAVNRNLKAANLHEEYSFATLQNDILMLTLDKPVTFNEYIRPACLWSGNNDLSEVVGRSATVAGWGEQGVGGVGRQGMPRKVNIPIVSTNDCRASASLFHGLTFDTTLCAGDRKGSGPCVGDSGGGLYLLEGGKWRVRGVVSVSLRAESGEATCNLNQYVVFTDTAKYLPWIKAIMAQN